MCLTLAFVDLFVPVRRVPLELAVRWCHETATSLGAQALVASVGKDLQGRATGQVLDQAQLPCVGDIGTARGLGWAGLQNRSLPPASVRTMALTAFCLFLPEMDFSWFLRPTAGLRTRISVPLSVRWPRGGR